MRAGFWLFILCATVLVSLGLQITLPSFLPLTTETNAFSDDFSSYPVGTFPSSGGWQLTNAGAGSELQTIVDSGTTHGRSMNLLGMSGNSALIKRDFIPSANMIGFEVSVRTDTYTGGGNNIAEIGFFNANLNKMYPKIMLTGSGEIWIEGEQYVLGAYAPQTWYALTLLIDKTARSYNVAIFGPGVTIDAKNHTLIDDPSGIQSFAVVGGWAGVKAYFDDIRVFGLEVNSLPLVARWLPWVSFGLLVPVASFLFFSEVKPGPGLARLSSKRSQLTAGGGLIIASLATWSVAIYAIHTTVDTAYVASITVLAALGPAIAGYYVARRANRPNKEGGTSTGRTESQSN